MLIAYNVVLSVALLVSSLMMVLLMRQIAMLSNRLPTEAMIRESSPLSAGSDSPITFLNRYDRLETVSLPLIPGESTCLLFASFGCAKCQPLLRELYALPVQLKRRVAVMILDGNLGQEGQALISRLHLDDLVVAEAHHVHREFRIRQTPCLYILNAANRVLAYIEPDSIEDVAKLLDHRRGNHDHLILAGEAHEEKAKLYAEI